MWKRDERMRWSWVVGSEEKGLECEVKVMGEEWVYLGGEGRE